MKKYKGRINPEEHRENYKNHSVLFCSGCYNKNTIDWVAYR